VAGAKSPIVARFAFEWFRESVENTEPNEDLSLTVLIRKWLQLSDDERTTYKRMAEDDHARFKAECEQWAERVAKSGKGRSVDVNQVLQQRQALLEKQLDAAHKKSTRRPAAKRQPHKQDADGQAQKRKRPPPGFPQFPRTPYSCFCREHSGKLRAGGSTGAAEGGCDGVIGKSQEQGKAVTEGKATALGSEVSSVGVEGVNAEAVTAAAGERAAMDAGEAVGNSARGEPTKRKRPALEILNYLRTAWKNLSDEERAHYDLISAQERERFRTEFEIWRQQQPDEGWGDGLPGNMLTKIRNTVGWNNRPRMKKPKIPRAQAINLINKRPHDMEMGEILQCAAAVGLQEGYDEKRRQAKEAKEAGAGPDGSRPSKQSVTDVQADDGDDAGDDDLLGMKSTSRSLPTPNGLPSVMQPSESVDDLLGELAVVDDAHDENESAGDLPLEDFDEYRNECALMPHDDFFGPPAIPAWKETPETMGAPTVLGPRLCFDSSGKIVLDESSLTKGVTEEHDPTEGVPIQESVSQYSSAYKKTPACKWSDEETEMFYEALALYGTDLFLVQTFFRNKSAAQIKGKFTREMKRNGKQVEDVLMRSVRKLTKEPFERMHGKIDTSKHYVPPSSPLPGEEREAEGAGLGEEEERMPEAEPPPPEPEYSAEDESLTTNRLMALFD